MTWFVLHRKLFLRTHSLPLVENSNGKISTEYKISGFPPYSKKKRKTKTKQSNPYLKITKKTYRSLLVSDPFEFFVCFKPEGFDHGE